MIGALRLAADIALTPQARSIAREQIQWYRREGVVRPCHIGRVLGFICESWEDAATALALAWEDCCGPQHTRMLDADVLAALQPG